MLFGWQQVEAMEGSIQDTIFGSRGHDASLEKYY